MIRFRNLFFLLIVLFGTWAVRPASTLADQRTEYLISMLEKGANYRIRVQAATTLGQLRCRESVPALTRALRDASDLVVIASAMALGKIGDPSVVSALESVSANPPSQAAKSQIEATLRILRALEPGGETIPAGPAKFLVRVDAMGDSTGLASPELLQTFKAIVVDSARAFPGVIVQDSVMTGGQVSEKLKEGKLKGYILSGSIMRMELAGEQLIVKIGLNVFTNPEYNLLMMPTAQGSVTVPSSGMDKSSERASQEKAVKAVTKKLVESIFQAVGEME